MVQCLALCPGSPSWPTCLKAERGKRSKLSCFSGNRWATVDMIDLPTMTVAQEQAWLTLLDIYEELATGWTIVGGQMVHLWCAERGVAMARPTDDADTVLDVRSEPEILRVFTAALSRRGFEAETTGSGVQHRWRKGAAAVDVLIPRHLGPVAANRTGVGGGRTIETPGAQKAVNRTETVQVRIGDRVGSAPRPSLLGALIAKAAAYTVPLDRNRARHLGDFALLATLLGPDDVDGHPGLDKRELELMMNAIGHARADPRTWRHVEAGSAGLDRLSLVVDTARRTRELSGTRPPPDSPSRESWGSARG